MMLIDGFQPEGITRLIQDSVFMFPHLGVLSSVEAEIAYEVFDKDAVIRLGSCIAPRGVPERAGDTVMEVTWTTENGETQNQTVEVGEIVLLPIPVGQTVEMNINPNRSCNVGEGNGRQITAQVEGGEAGILLDGRGRPIQFPEDQATMKSTLIQWIENLEAYPADAIKRFKEEAN
jgi:hypothetical protein